MLNLMKTCQVKINCHVAFSENKAAEKTTAQYMLRHPIEFKANCLVSFVLLIPVTICCLHAVHSSLQYSALQWRNLAAKTQYGFLEGSSDS